MSKMDEAEELARAVVSASTNDDGDFCGEGWVTNRIEDALRKLIQERDAARLVADAYQKELAELRKGSL